MVKLIAGVGGADVPFAPPPHAEAKRRPASVSNVHLGKRQGVTLPYYVGLVLCVAMVRHGWQPL
jgi:hypothetical protein